MVQRSSAGFGELNAGRSNKVTPRYQFGSPPAKVSPEILELLAECETATIGHWRHWGFCRQGIQSLLPGKKIVGRAITVTTPGPCATMLHHAVDVLEPGDILVVDRVGDERYACWGGGVTMAVRAAGAVGGIVDGPCTDFEEIRDLNFPVWCRGLTPNTAGAYNLGGRLNFPVSIGGAVIQAGDVLLCDSSGILVLPPDEAESEARRAIDAQREGKAKQRRLLAGESLAEISGARARLLDVL